MVFAGATDVTSTCYAQIVQSSDEKTSQQMSLRSTSAVKHAIARFFKWHRFVSLNPGTKAADMVCLTATEKQIDAVLAPSREAGSPSNSARMGNARRCSHEEQNAKLTQAAKENEATGIDKVVATILSIKRIT